MNVIERRKRLIDIAECIKAGVTLSDANASFLCEALIKIAQGDDPNDALDTKAKKGEKTSTAYIEKQKLARNRKSLALSWLATATAPEEDGGLGLSNEIAIGMIGELSPIPKDVKAFGFTEETLKSYLARNPDKRERTFKLPD